MRGPLRKEANAQVRPWSPSAYGVLDSDGELVGWLWWVGGNGGAYAAGDPAGRVLVPETARAKTVRMALAALERKLAPPAPSAPPPAPVPAAAPTPARPAQPEPRRRQLVRPDAPVVPRTAGVRRRKIEVGFHDDEKRWLQEQADRETGGVVAEFIRRRALRGMPGREG